MLSDKDFLETLKRNGLAHDNFMEAAAAIGLDFPHDLFDNLPVGCIYYLPELKNYLKKYGITKLTGWLGAFFYGGRMPDAGIVIINLPTMVLHHMKNVHEAAQKTLVHEYLHAYMRYHKVLRKQDASGKSISEKLGAARRAFKNTPEYNAYVKMQMDSYEKKYKRNVDNLNEEFMVQAYTTRFNRYMDILGTQSFDEIREAMMEVHPYFERANMPKHLAKKIEKITF